MTAEQAFKVLRCIDGAPHTLEVRRIAASFVGNAQGLHAAMRTALVSDEWIEGPTTDEVGKFSPHVRKWDNLVKGQRDEFRSLTTATPVPTVTPSEEPDNG